MNKTDVFIASAKEYAGDECLIWPYARNDQGYPQIRRGKNIFYVHRIICEAVNGSAPTDKHEAAHSCNRGKDGCVNGGHLSWKTHLENMQDKKAHGTHLRGEKQNGAKLTESDVIDIISLKGWVKQKVLAESYGVQPNTISRILSGKRWGWIT